MSDEELFYQRLRRLRQQRGMTAKEVAEQIGVSPTTYREWEYGRSILGEPYLKLAKVFGVSVHELLSGLKNSHEDLEQEVHQAIEHLNKLKDKMHSLD